VIIIAGTVVQKWTEKGKTKMRDKLSNMIQSAVNGCAKYWADVIADKLIAEGVIVPICKVGQTVYYPIYHINKVVQLLVSEIIYTKNNIRYWASYLAFSVDDIGKIVFLTREEAEKALAERSEE
jgi:hypothetical protein